MPTFICFALLEKKIDLRCKEKCAESGDWLALQRKMSFLSVRLRASLSPQISRNSNLSPRILTTWNVNFSLENRPSGSVLEKEVHICILFTRELPRGIDCLESLLVASHQWEDLTRMPKRASYTEPCRMDGGTTRVRVLPEYMTCGEGRTDISRRYKVA